MFAIYQRVIAAFYVYGALVHAGNLLGFGPEIPENRKTVFTTLDVIFLVLDIAVVVGLWRRRTWGLVLFLTAAGAQLVMYLGFPDYFATSPEFRAQIRILVIFHVVTVSLMLVFWSFDSRRV